MSTSGTFTVKFLQAGATGAKGAALRGPQAWSDCAVGYEFQAGGDDESFIDVVMYNDNYYYCKTSHTKTASNYPLSTTSETNNLWTLGDKIGLVATTILLAEYAKINNLGASAIEMSDDDGNVLVSIKDGVVTCNIGNFNNITVNSGALTDMAISGSTRVNVFDLTPTSADLGYLVRPDNNSRIFVSAVSAAYEIYLLEYPNGTELEIIFTPAVFTRTGVPITTIYSFSGFIDMSQGGNADVTRTNYLSVADAGGSVVNGGYAHLIFKDSAWYIVSMTGGCYTY